LRLTQKLKSIGEKSRIMNKEISKSALSQSEIAGHLVFFWTLIARSAFLIFPA